MRQRAALMLYRAAIRLEPQIPVWIAAWHAREVHRASARAARQAKLELLAYQQQAARLAVRQ